MFNNNPLGTAFSEPEATEETPVAKEVYFSNLSITFEKGLAPKKDPVSWTAEDLQAVVTMEPSRITEYDTDQLTIFSYGHAVDTYVSRQGQINSAHYQGFLLTANLNQPVSFIPQIALLAYAPQEFPVDSYVSNAPFILRVKQDGRMECSLHHRPIENLTALTVQIAMDTPLQAHGAVQDEGESFLWMLSWDQKSPSMKFL